MFKSAVFSLAALAVFASAQPSRGAVQYSITDLGTLGGNLSVASAINASGEVVGYSTTPDGTIEAFLYSGGTMVGLGAFGGEESEAIDINNAGYVVGVYTTVGDTADRAFVYSNGNSADLGSLGGPNSSASGINNSGQIVGASTPADGNFHALIYQYGIMSDLGTFGGTEASARAINDSGQIAGNFSTGTIGADFRIVLSHSRKGYAEAVQRQTTDDFLRCLENAFTHFGGMPSALVIDNLRAAVKAKI